MSPTHRCQFVYPVIIPPKMNIHKMKLFTSFALCVSKHTIIEMSPREHWCALWPPTKAGPAVYVRTVHALCTFAFVGIFCASDVLHFESELLIGSVWSTPSETDNVTNVQPARTTGERDRLATVTSLNYIRQVIKLPASECQQARSGILTSNLQTGRLQQQGARHTETLKL